MTQAPAADRPYFAAFLDLKGKPAVAPRRGARLSELALLGALRPEPRRFQPGDLVGAEIAIAATDDPAVNEAVSAAAKSLRMPVNVADHAALSTFIMPAVVDRPPLQIAISTGGSSPVLARKLRALIEAAVPSGFGRLAGLIGRFRGASKERYPDPEARRRFWEEVVEGPEGELALSGNEAAAIEKLEARLHGRATAPRGFVSLVGGGPGDPDLVTLRALRALQKASVVLYDKLVSPRIVDLARREAERIYVGKARDNHALPQEEINALMVRLAREGKRVVRLKGGDPFIFGRGGEEIEALAAQGIDFEVVPGVTAASGAAAYAGIPLTHRDFADACVFLTGHLKEDSVLDLEGLARPRQTIVVYMGVGALGEICKRLVEAGLAPSLPCALVQKATLPEQRVLEGTLASLPGLAADAQVRPPALLVVGEVVRLRAKLRWFEPAAYALPEEVSIPSNR